MKRHKLWLCVSSHYYWMFCQHGGMDSEPRAPQPSFTQSLPSPLPDNTAQPQLSQPRKQFIPTPLCCSAVTISGRTELWRSEQLVSKGRRSGNQPPCQVTWRELQEPFILLYSLCTSLRISPALLFSYLFVLPHSLSFPPCPAVSPT